MTDAESSPIVILSEDENDDDDDIVVLGEEKIAITADDDSDDDNNEVIFISQSQPSPSLIAKVKDENNGALKIDSSSSKDLSRSLSLTTAFDLSLTLAAPLDLSKHTENVDSTKLDKEAPLVDLEDSQHKLADDLLNSVAGSSLDSSLIGSVSSSSNDSDSDDPAISPQVQSSANWPVKISPQPSSSGGLKSTCTSNASRASSASDIDEFLELFKSYDQSQPQASDNQSSVTVITPVAPLANIQSGCDNTKSSSPGCLSSFSSPVLQSQADAKWLPSHDVTTRDNKTDTTLMVNVPPATAAAATVPKSKAIVDDNLFKSSLSTIPNSPLPSTSSGSLNHTSCNSSLGPVGCVSTSNQTSKSSSGSETICQTGISSANTCQSGSQFQNSQTGIGLGTSLSLTCQTGFSSGSGTSSGTSYQSGLSCYKLSQYSLPPRKRVRPDINNVNTDPSTGSKLEDWNCVNCKFILQDLKISRCTQGHPACGSCLEDQVKLILTDKQGSLKCIMVNCGSYYPISELKHTLPSMVVDILEDKLHKDYINFVSDMMLKDTGGNDDPSSKKSKLDDDSLQQFDVLKELPEEKGAPKSLDDPPPNWEAMDNMNFVIITLEPESEEYVDIALKFHSTLTFPSADIVKISRVQNPILWRYYQLKRTEMIHDHEGHVVEEKQLFHGTSSSVIEAICRKGFDWRMCGKHGSVYGQGSYFAKAASYSHQYTERINGSGPSGNPGLRSRMMAIRNQLRTLRSHNLPAPRQMPNKNHILLGPLNQMQVSQIMPNNLLPPPAHMPIQPPIPGLQSIQNRNNLSSNLTIIASNFTGSLPSSTTGGHGLPSNQAPPSMSVNVPSSSSSVVFPSTPQSAFHLAMANTLVIDASQPSFTPTTSSSSSNSNTNNNFSQTIPTPKASKDPKSRILSVSDLVASSSRKMFLAKVLVGKYTGGNTSYRRPPPLYPTEPYGKCYDSCVDHIWDPKIFVIFDTNQAYPEYIVEYTVSNGD